MTEDHRDAGPLTRVTLDQELLARRLRGSDPTLTIGEAADRVQLTLEQILRINRAAGFADPEPDAPVFNEDDVEVFVLSKVAMDFFGDDQTVQFARVAGLAMSRVADTAISMFVSSIGERSKSAAIDLDSLADANQTAIDMLPAAIRIMDVLLRRHMAQRSRDEIAMGTEWHGIDALDRAVGFCDLVGYTSLSARVSTIELAALLARFEERASDRITGAGGIVVKLIGDEVMFVASDAPTAVGIAGALVAAFPHDGLPPVRIGLAAGNVIVREGDYHGPVVNLAARLVKLAPPGGVIAPSDFAAHAAGFATEEAGTPSLKGFDAPISVVRLTPK